MNYFVGVDVGTGSARAALFNKNGKLIKIATNSIKTFNYSSVYYEQSSEDIWNSVKKVVKEVVGDISNELIKGIGFDATCSLVLLDDAGKPVTASLTGDDERNIILWMDHRAEIEANIINEMNHEVLKFVGGKISLEMEIPKIMWLKKNLPETFKRVKLFFDLPDFLTWKATGSESRSLCSLVCKWNYNANNGWNEDFLTKIGLSCLKENNWKKIGNIVKSPGEPIENGLSELAAFEFGLKKGTPVGISIIDAHAGGLGMIGVSSLDNNKISKKFSSRLSIICGTSTCHMAISSMPIFLNGIWGPYYSAMIPNYYLNEGGQSATGKLIDYIINNHPATIEINKKINNTNIHIQEYLTNLLLNIAKDKNLNDISYLTNNIHIWPDFHGNRSPLADPYLQGMISGLSLNNDEYNLAIIYLATLQSIIYGTKHIYNYLNNNGYDIKTILICGGLSKNFLFCKIHADVIGVPILIPDNKESVLLGSAILGACASKKFHNIDNAIFNMAGNAKIIEPDNKIKQYHEKKYKVFLKMVQDQKDYQKIMNEND